MRRSAHAGASRYGRHPASAVRGVSVLGDQKKKKKKKVSDMEFVSAEYNHEYTVAA